MKTLITLLLSCMAVYGNETQTTWYIPKADSTWHIQLLGDLNTSYDVDVYDLDLFDAPEAVIDRLHDKGKKVVCYFSAGSFEHWREDAKLFSEQEIGNTMEGWENEKWLDIRSKNVRKIMHQRIDFAKQKGCDAIDPDNVNGYLEKTGFALTKQDQLDFNRFLAYSAHERGLGIGLKNSLEQIEALVDLYDFTVNEECMAYEECHLLKPFHEAGKAIFNIEYEAKFAKKRQETCRQAVKYGMRTLILPLLLDDTWRISCQ